MYSLENLLSVVLQSGQIKMFQANFSPVNGRPVNGGPVNGRQSQWLRTTSHDITCFPLSSIECYRVSKCRHRAPISRLGTATRCPSSWHRFLNSQISSFQSYDTPNPPRTCLTAKDKPSRRPQSLVCPAKLYPRGRNV